MDALAKKKKSIPAVEAEALEVDIASYPKLTGESEPGSGDFSSGENIDSKPDLGVSISATKESGVISGSEKSASLGEPGADRDNFKDEVANSAEKSGAREAASVSNPDQQYQKKSSALEVRRLSAFWNNAALGLALVALVVAVVSLSNDWKERVVIDDLSASIKALDKASVEVRSSQKTLVEGIVLLRLTAKVRSGRSFVDELASATELFAQIDGVSSHLDMLRPLAETGLPLVGHLRENFRDIVLPEARKAKVSSLLESIAFNIGRVFPGKGISNEPRADLVNTISGIENLYRADRAMQFGDLESAAAIAAAFGEDVPSVRNWITSSNQFLDAQRALAVLDDLGLNNLSNLAR